MIDKNEFHRLVGKEVIVTEVSGQEEYGIVTGYNKEYPVPYVVVTWNKDGLIVNYSENHLSEEGDKLRLGSSYTVTQSGEKVSRLDYLRKIRKDQPGTDKVGNWKESE